MTLRDKYLEKGVMKTLIFQIALILFGYQVFLIGCSQNKDEEFSFDKIYNYAIQEDAAKIIKALNAVPDDSLTVEQLELKQKYISRFQTKTEKFNFKTQDSLIVNVLTIFQDYWIDALMKKQPLHRIEENHGPILSELIRNYPCEKSEIINSEDLNVS